MAPTGRCRYPHRHAQRGRALRSARPVRRRDADPGRRPGPAAGDRLAWVWLERAGRLRRHPAGRRRVPGNRGVVTWEIGSLSGGSSGSVEMTVRAPASRPEAGMVVNGSSSMVSREAATISGPQVVTSIVDGPPPVVEAVVEAGTASVYVLQGGDFMLRAEGANFRPGARLDPGPGISAGPATLETASRLTVPVTVQGSADLGPRTVTVTNPDGLSGSRPAAIVVVRTADIDDSCRIDGGDLNVLARAWNTVAGDPRFRAAADLDGDRFVGPLDLVILAEYFGQKLAACP